MQSLNEFHLQPNSLFANNELGCKWSSLSDFILSKASNSDFENYSYTIDYFRVYYFMCFKYSCHTETFECTKTLTLHSRKSDKSGRWYRSWNWGNPFWVELTSSFFPVLYIRTLKGVANYLVHRPVIHKLWTFKNFMHMTRFNNRVNHGNICRRPLLHLAWAWEKPTQTNSTKLLRSTIDSLHIRNLTTCKRSMQSRGTLAIYDARMHIENRMHACTIIQLCGLTLK